MRVDLERLQFLVGDQYADKEFIISMLFQMLNKVLSSESVERMSDTDRISYHTLIEYGVLVDKESPANSAILELENKLAYFESELSLFESLYTINWDDEMYKETTDTIPESLRNDWENAAPFKKMLGVKLYPFFNIKDTKQNENYWNQMLN